MKNNIVWIIGGIALLLMAGTKAFGFAVKSGAVVPTTHEMRYAAQVVARVWQQHGFTATLTSGLDGEHKDDSLHYSGLATDWRTKNLPAITKQQMIAEVADILGRDYDVLIEYAGTPNEHMHIEYDPRF
jgi:hypothetical protein